jgi:RNA polymerase sigma factor FliA
LPSTPDKDLRSSSGRSAPGAKAGSDLGQQQTRGSAKPSSTSDKKEDLLTKYGAYVRSLANAVRKQFGGRLDIEDLVAYGNIGLFEAWERFDSKIGANFLTFAHYRIKGAIYDGLRKMGTLRGADASRTFISERASTYMRNVADRDTGGPRTYADDVRDVSDAVSALATVYAASYDALDGLNLRDDSVPADERLEQAQLKARVKAAIDKLPAKEKTLLLGYYYQGKTLEEAGGALELSKSWASRLHERAIEELRDLLADENASSDAGAAGASRRQVNGEHRPPRSEPGRAGPHATAGDKS